MPQDAKSLCRRYGLNYIETGDLRLRRRRCGKGFAYIDAAGGNIRDKAAKARIKQLAIPPAWTEVCIAEDERAHIQPKGDCNIAITPIGTKPEAKPRRRDCAA